MSCLLVPLAVPRLVYYEPALLIGRYLWGCLQQELNSAPVYLLGTPYQLG
jgi:hypothetical protein